MCVVRSEKVRGRKMWLVLIYRICYVERQLNVCVQSVEVGWEMDAYKLGWRKEETFEIVAFWMVR